MPCFVLEELNKGRSDSSSPNHINSIVGISTEEKWRLTGIYGFADLAKEGDTWTLLRQLHSRPSMSWLCAGDFNKILQSHEKCGLGPRSKNQMKAFQDVLDEARLKDLGYVGKKIHLERPPPWWSSA